MRPQRAGSIPQRADPTPQRLEPAPSRASSAGHQRPRRTLRVDPVEGSSQGRLAFNNQPSESIRAASFSASPAYSAREDFRESMRVGPPSFREQPAGDDVPWFSRQQGENIVGQIGMLMEIFFKK